MHVILKPFQFTHFSQRPSQFGYLRKLLGAITAVVVRDWNAPGEGPATNSYKLIHLS